MKNLFLAYLVETVSIMVHRVSSARVVLPDNISYPVIFPALLCCSLSCLADDCWEVLFIVVFMFLCLLWYNMCNSDI